MRPLSLPACVSGIKKMDVRISPLNADRMDMH